MLEVAETPTEKLATKRGVEPPNPGEIIVRLRRELRLSNDELLQFCQDNDELRIEQTAEGNLIIMAPVSYEGSRRNFQLLGLFAVWGAQTNHGEFTDSSAGFILADGAMRSPDVAWVQRERLQKLSSAQREGFLPLCPDFVVELRSRTDRLSALQKKRAEYLENGARLGWLIDPLERQVFVYRPDEPVEHLQNPATLSGEPVLAGFTLDLARVW